MPVGLRRRGRSVAWCLPLLLAAFLFGPFTRPASAQALFILRVLGGLLEPNVPAPEPGASAPAVPGSTPEDQFQQQLLQGDLPTLNQACLEAANFGFNQRLRLLQARLLEMAPAPQPLPTVLANANALLSCRAPDAALAVLNRYSPAAGLERDQWLVQRWRAAQAGLHHGLAAETLETLAQGVPANLETQALPVKVHDDGTIETRSALDVYAEHLLVLGRSSDAAAALLAGQMPGRLAAERLQLAVSLLDAMPWQERDQLLERALDQAAASQSWGLAIALLQDQRRLLAAEAADTTHPSERLERLTARVDDAYSAWQLTRQDPSQSEREAELQQQLRSPRSPGGHASAFLTPSSP